MSNVKDKIAGLELAGKIEADLRPGLADLRLRFTALPPAGKIEMANHLIESGDELMKAIGLALQSSDPTTRVTSASMYVRVKTSG